ncbi:SGNH/GDSL hydrolase family protein [Sphingobium indicum]|uniref:SGNH/GDSL hydrolase family protein n=1 Tax=Sphingobium indicum TaxID=332055 RepID=A0A4Q4J5X3_9SPHN|nr:SGNH/GDSL hydrolase family protein [Sphingobium indicum]NYI23512.1 lysophospholipase L1-like esterase [Sphingobium indicum]RYM01622.1 SGNH/GDSL hydrolase family protein [Sphingobium indicum]
MRLTLAAFLLPLAACVATPAWAASCPGHWTAAWASAQMAPTGDNALAPGMLADSSLRQIVRPSIAGDRLRVRLSNLAGTAPLHIRGASIARALRAGSPAIDAKTLIPLRFDGRGDVTIPAGAEYLSDPVALPVRAFDDLAISIAFDEEPSGQTSHPGSRATSWLLKGDHLTDPAMAGAQTVEHWFSLAGLEVERCAAAQLIVALGDSITDGRGSTTNGNDRWTDNLARRLQADPATRHLAIVNQGIGGNRLLNDGLGPNALARLDRDVLAQPGARFLILLEGINDIGTLTRETQVSDAEHARLVSRIIGAYRQIVMRARARGIKVIGGTILPFVGNDYYHPDARNEADRQAVNRWIREPGNFDGVIDFDRAMRDPAHPDRLLPRYDVGDALHPSPEGYRAMAEAIPLDLFK